MAKSTTRGSTGFIGTGTAVPAADAQVAPDRWQPPVVQVICLACEISAYAPDGDLPLL